MSVIVMLQGRELEDRATSQLALLLARHLNTAIDGLCALPDPAHALMAADASMGAGLSMSTLSSVSRLQDELIANAKGAFSDTTSSGAHGLQATFRHETALPVQAAADAAVLADAIIFRARPRAHQSPSRPLSKTR